MAKLSIIIPTYNRASLLKKVLKKINKQSYDLKNVEVLVLDDFSIINPKPEIVDLKLKYKLRFFRMKKHMGQGMLRNVGIKLARGKYILFMGDDTLPKTNLFEKHMKLHHKYSKIAVLGRVYWANKLRNEFMDFIENIQFHYQTIKNNKDVKLHFYTSNISLEKSWFKDESFSREFNNYGLEDLELGYRLEKRGLRIIYNPRAIVYHHHCYNFEQFCKRMKNTGKSAVIFTKLHPELKRKYIPYFKGIIKLSSNILSKGSFKYFNKKLYWYSNFIRSYLDGIEEELNSHQFVGNKA